MNIITEFLMLSLDVRVNILLCILSFLLAAASIIIVVLTLRQNSKMIESSTRPYITTYVEVSENLITVVVKNYGNSSGKIVEFQPSIDFSTLTHGTRITPFSNLSGFTFAPGQAISCIFEYRTFVDLYDSFNIKLSYTSGKKKYTDNVTFNLTALRELFSARVEIKAGEELKHITKSLISIDKKLMQIK